MKRFGKNLDKRVFFGSVALVMPFIVIGVISPQLLGRWSDHALAAITDMFGWFFLSGVNLCVAVCLVLAISPLGRIRLGNDGEKPEFSRFSWFAMLFSAGMGIGLVFWSIAEPLYHFAGPPQGQANTVDSARLALTIFFYHWGVHAWAVYVAVGLPLAFFQFRRGLPATVSSCLGMKEDRGMRIEQRAPFKVIVDILAVWATIMGVVTSLGLGAMQIATGLSVTYGFVASPILTSVIIAVITALFLVSAASGVNKGIKILSELNVVLMILLFLVFLCFGPFSYLIHSFFQALADYLEAIIPLSTTFTLFGNKQWTNNWTVFYWAWWIAWAPFVGAFIARISKGRTVREFILCTILLPSIVSFLFATALGGTAIHLQLFDQVPIVATVGKSIEAGLFETLRHLPGFTLTALLANLLIVSFFVTSADSATLVIASFTSGGRGEEDGVCQRPLILFWGLLLGVLAIVLVSSGGLKALQTASIVGALPFLILMFGIQGNFVRELIREKAAQD
jgi:glycine betaine transporter